jgi:hypothetical protein
VCGGNTAVDGKLMTMLMYDRPPHTGSDPSILKIAQEGRDYKEIDEASLRI